MGVNVKDCLLDVCEIVELVHEQLRTCSGAGAAWLPSAGLSIRVRGMKRDVNWLAASGKLGVNGREMVLDGNGSGKFVTVLYPPASMLAAQDYSPQLLPAE